MTSKTCLSCVGMVPVEASHCPSCGALQPEAPARLHRGHPDRVLAGVCAGIGAQFGMDAVIVRVFLVIAALVSLGTAAWAYVVLWALMPDRPGESAPAAKVSRKLKGLFTAQGLPTTDTSI